MIDQKNHMDPALTELLFLKSEVDFELLWRCISKIPNLREGGAWEWEEDFSNLNNKIVYKNSIVEFAMFILVSLPLGLVTGGLSGSPWSTFQFLSWLTKSLYLQNTLCSQGKIQKFKKVASWKPSFFIRKVFMSADLA